MVREHIEYFLIFFNLLRFVLWPRTWPVGEYSMCTWICALLPWVECPMYTIWLLLLFTTSLPWLLKSPAAIVNLLLRSVLSVFASRVLKRYGDVRTLSGLLCLVGELMLLSCMMSVFITGNFLCSKAYFDINIANAIFFWLVFTQHIFYCPFTSNLPVTFEVSFL